MVDGHPEVEPRDESSDANLRIKWSYKDCNSSGTRPDFDMIKAEDADDSTVIYRPESGVNQEDYEALSPYLIPEDREVLACWVLANILVQRGVIVPDADRLAMNDRLSGLDLGAIEEKGWDRLADEVQEAARSKLE